MRKRERWRRWPVAAGVLALHGLLLWALRPDAPAPRPTPPQQQTVTWLRLLADTAPPVQPATPTATRVPRPQGALRPAPPAAPTAAPPAAPPAASPVVAPPVEPQAITLPAPAPSPPPLMLALPPPPAGSAPGWREQMLRDPRANSRPARGTTEALQSLAGDDRRREETMAGEGRRRVRVAGACVEVHQARMAQLDPHNQSSNPLPAQVRSCD